MEGRPFPSSQYLKIKQAAVEGGKFSAIHPSYDYSLTKFL